MASRAATVLALVLIVEGASAEAAATPACAHIDQIDFARKSALPRGAAAALGFDVAEIGEPFQATDVVVRPGLPWRRFVAARQIGCKLQIVFDIGGRGLSRASIDLLFVDGRWTTLRREEGR